MSDWMYAQADPSEELAQLHYFSVKQRSAAGEVELVITVREYVARNSQNMRFFAQADKPVGDDVGAHRPFGWGDTLLAALGECLRAVRLAAAR